MEHNGMEGRCMYRMLRQCQEDTLTDLPQQNMIHREQNHVKIKCSAQCLRHGRQNACWSNGILHITCVVQRLHMT